MSRRSTTPKRSKRTPTPKKRGGGTPASVAGTDIDAGDDLEFDLGLETPGRNERRRSSFYERSREVLSYASKQTSTHIGFVLLVFAIFSITLSPFLYRVPKIVRVPVNQGPSECPCNTTRMEYFDNEVVGLKSDLATAIRVYEEETKKADDIIVLQYEAIRAVESSIAKLSKKHDEVMLLTSEGGGGGDGKGSSEGEGSATGNIFSTIRDDMGKLKSQVQSLSDTHLMIQQFNSHAENLIARSREIEVLIQAQNESLAESGRSSSSNEECKPCEQVAAPAASQECVSTEKGADFVNLDMARQIITDEVARECKKKIEEVHEIYDLKMRSIGEECSEQCVKATAVAEVEQEINRHNQHTNFASRKAGATVLHDHTSATWQPEAMPDLASRTVGMIKGQESLWDKTVGQLSGKTMEQTIDLGALESSLRNTAEIVGVTRKPEVGVPEDALSADMSLGSCWPMANGSGHITVKLARPVLLAGLSIEHIPYHEAVDVRSAPKDFRLYTLTDPTLPNAEETLVVEGAYSIEAGVVSSQLFDAQSVEPVEYIRLEILSNHGHPHFACLYRIRIHGSS